MFPGIKNTTSLPGVCIVAECIFVQQRLTESFSSSAATLKIENFFSTNRTAEKNV